MLMTPEDLEIMRRLKWVPFDQESGLPTNAQKRHDESISRLLVLMKNEGLDLAHQSMREHYASK